jgi:hypothetical protein
MAYKRMAFIDHELHTIRTPALIRMTNERHIFSGIRLWQILRGHW